MTTNPGLPEKTVITVSVRPGASRTEITGELSDGTLKIAVAAPPEDDRANRELIRFLAQYYNISSESVSIISGKRGRRKLIRLNSK